MQRVGIISDTHGLLRPEALAALQSSDLIIHAGDIGSPEILAALRIIAPLHVIRGNNDTEPWAGEIPDTLSLEVNGRTFFLIHNVKELDFRPSERGVDVVIAGHSHRPRNELVDGVLYFNPGSSGPRRFQLPITVGRLIVDHTEIRGEIIPLNVSGTSARKKAARKQRRT